LHPSCSHCRQEVSESDKFCPNCGNTLPGGGSVAAHMAAGENTA
jgi:predicted amidophosphoribosyltransferase